MQELGTDVASRKAIARLTAAGERPSLRPAAARLPSSSAATKTFIASMRSIIPPRKRRCARDRRRRALSRIRSPRGRVSAEQRLFARLSEQPSFNQLNRGRLARSTFLHPKRNNKGAYDGYRTESR